MGNQKKPSRKSAAPNTDDHDEELHSAARSGDLEAVQRICATNPLAINSRDKHSRTPLHLAAWSGQTKVVDFLCKKADVGATAMDDMGAVHFAAQKGHVEVVRILVNAGVSTKSCNRKGMTALHYAAQASHLQLVKFLIKKGANVNSKNKAGNTPVDLASNEEVRAFLVECQTTSSSKVLNSKDSDSEAQPKASLQENTHNAKKEVEVEDGEYIKRKSNDDITSEILPQVKKTKVALSHLLASDDTQVEED